MSNGAQSERESEAGGEKVGRETLGQMLDEADEPLTRKDWLGARQRQEIRIWPASTTPTCVYCRATSSYSLGEHRTIINHRLIKTGSCESGFTAEGRASVPVHRPLGPSVLLSSHTGKPKGGRGAGGLTNVEDNRSPPPPALCSKTPTSITWVSSQLDTRDITGPNSIEKNVTGW